MNNARASAFTGIGDQQLAINNSALLDAASSLDGAARVAELIPVSDVNCKDACGRTPLLRAALFGCADTVALLAQVANVHATFQGNTAIWFAAIRASNSPIEGVRALLDRVNVPEALGLKGLGVQNGNALMHAARLGNDGMVELLLPFFDANDVNACGRTALMMAAGNGRLGCVNLLMEKSDLGVRDHLGMDALCAAAREGHADVVAALIPRCDPLGGCKYGWTALMHAAMRGHDAAVGLLLEKSDVAALDKDGKTAADLARELGPRCADLAAKISAYSSAQLVRGILEADVAAGRGPALKSRSL